MTYTHSMLVDRLRSRAPGLDEARVGELASAVVATAEITDPARRWHELAQTVLRPSDPFAIHQVVRDCVYLEEVQPSDPPPLWLPLHLASGTPSVEANLTSCLRDWNFSTYESLYAWSIQDRASFWERTIDRLGIRFRVTPEQTLDVSAGLTAARWLCGARLNIVESCFQAPEDHVAIVFGGPDGNLTTWSYGDLQQASGRVAASLIALGCVAGDPIAIVMTMTVESVAIYLGIAWMGGVVVSIADSFAAPEIAKRLQIARARYVFCENVIVRQGKRLSLYDRVCEATDLPVIVLAGEATSHANASPPSIPSSRTSDMTWDAFLASAAPGQPVVPVDLDPDAALNVLFSSGTTGDPKAIPWSHTTPIKAAADGYFHQDIHPGDVVTWPTNLGWMMGPWLIFATLINRGTMGLFGDAPSGRSFGEFIESARVNILGVIPTLVRHWRQSECMKGLDWSAVRLFSSTGECSSPDDMFYLMHLAGYRPVIEYCGGTEVGGGYIASTRLHPHAPSLFSGPTLGTQIVLLDAAQHPTHCGEVFIVPPTIGLSTRLLNGDHDRVYYEGTPAGPAGQPLRRHGDHLEHLPNGQWRALGRVDDAMNLGGIKVGSAEIERVLNQTPGIRETAAIALSADGDAESQAGPSRLVVFAVPDGSSLDVAELLANMNQRLKKQLNPLFRVEEVCLVDALPRTASNKVMRRELRSHKLC